MQTKTSAAIPGKDGQPRAKQALKHFPKEWEGLDCASSISGGQQDNFGSWLGSGSQREQIQVCQQRLFKTQLADSSNQDSLTVWVGRSIAIGNGSIRLVIRNLRDCLVPVPKGSQNYMQDSMCEHRFIFLSKGSSVSYQVLKYNHDPPNFRSHCLVQSLILPVWILMENNLSKVIKPQGGIYFCFISFLWHFDHLDYCQVHPQWAIIFLGIIKPSGWLPWATHLASD